jgi:hypothetical protein
LIMRRGLLVLLVVCQSRSWRASRPLTADSAAGDLPRVDAAHGPDRHGEGQEGPARRMAHRERLCRHRRWRSAGHRVRRLSEAGRAAAGRDRARRGQTSLRPGSDPGPLTDTRWRLAQRGAAARR